MSRPVKLRKVEYVPQGKFFAPCPKRGCERWEEVNLKIEELEAMRLKDIEGLTQEECAERMQISRQTFQNIIDEAREKVTSALMEDKAISIGGGNYTKNVCNFVCLSCGREVTSAFEKRDSTCRYCGSTQLVCNKSCHNKCKNEGLEDCL
ncbi:MAG: DUF134 domain-containing protein [Desulfitobacteriaceae bacterium]|nr:DUF134 domain-containing protein [Desulfitobacteriaceae bacterium]MDI6914905.1 DUF134 domain-containing protein [Desulfitobacteriaceae bacterium]